MVAFANEILAPGVAALAAGGLYQVAARGLAPTGGPLPKAVLIVPVFGLGTSIAGVWAGGGWSSMTNAAYCSSLAALGWFGSSLYYKRGT